MNDIIKTLILSLAVSFPLAPQSFSQDADDNTAAATEPAAEPDPAVAARQNFINLPKEKREEFGRKLMKAQGLFNQKRIFDTIQVIDELDKIYKGHPVVMNLQGACYVEIRAFDKAYPIFEKLLEMSPQSTNVRFNLAEVDFVSKKWELAHKRFTELITLLPESNKSMLRLCEFKLLLCKIKTNRLNEAIALRDKYDEWDDSPFYYYSRAAVLFHQDDKPAAEKLLRDARFIWSNNASLASWQDTMIEFGYVRSFYGGDTEEPGGSVLVKPGTAPVIQVDSQ